MAATRREFLNAAAALGAASAFGSSPLHRVSPPALPREPGRAFVEPPLPRGVFRRLGSARFRCENGSYGLHFSADGSELISHTDDDVEVFDAKIGHCVRRFCIREEGHWNYAVQYLQRDRFAVLQRFENGLWRVVLFDRDGKVLKRGLAGEFPSRQVAFSPAGDRFYAVEDGILAAFDCESFAVLWTRKLSDSATANVVPTRDGRTLIFFDGPQLIVLDEADGIVRRTIFLPAHGDFSRRIGLPEFCISDDGRFACVPTYTQTDDRIDTVAHLCDLEEGRVVWSREGLHRSLGFIKGGRELLAWLQGELTVLDTQTGRTLRRLPSVKGGHFALSPDRRTLALKYGGAGIGFADIATGRILPHSADPLQPTDPATFLDDGRIATPVDDSSGYQKRRWWIWEIGDGTRTTLKAREERDHCSHHIAPNGLRYAVVGQEKIAILETETHRLLADYRYRDAVTDGLRISNAGSWTPDSGHFAMPVGERVLLLSAQTGLAQYRRAKIPGWTFSGYFAASNGGCRIVAIYNPFPGGFNHRNLERSASVTTYDGATDTANSFELSDFECSHLAEHAGRFAGTYKADGNFLQVRETTRGTVIWELPSSPNRIEQWPTLAPDGRSLAMEVRTRVPDTIALEIREVYTGGVRRRVPLPSAINRIAFSPDGRILLTEHPTAPIFLWDVYRERTDPQPKPGADACVRAWADLASADAAVGFRAMRLFVQHPVIAISLLKSELGSAPAIEEAKVNAWIGHLGSGSYREREAAEKYLAGVADECLPQLKATLSVEENPEIQRRLEMLIGNAGKPTPSTIRAIRLVEILEAIRTPDAKALCEAWSKGPTDRVLTREACATLSRWG